MGARGAQSKGEEDIGFVTTAFFCVKIMYCIPRFYGKVHP